MNRFNITWLASATVITGIIGYIVIVIRPVLLAALVVVSGMSTYANAADRQFVVGFPQDNMADEWRAAQVKAVADGLARHPDIKFIHTDAGGDTSRNIIDLEDMIDQRVDLLIVSPRDAVAMSPVLADAYRTGIPVILLTRHMVGEEYTMFIGPNDITIAAQAAVQIAKSVNGKGRVLILEGVPTATTAINRTKGFRAAIKAYPDVEIAAIRPANYLRADAIHVVQEMIENNVPFDAIYSHDDAMASGARVALRSAGIDPATVPIVGIDYIAEAREAIRAGTQIASFTYPTCGEEAAAYAIKILRGEPVPRAVEVPSVRVTRENVETVDTIF